MNCPEKFTMSWVTSRQPVSLAIINGQQDTGRSEVPRVPGNTPGCCPVCDHSDLVLVFFYFFLFLFFNCFLRFFLVALPDVL